MVTVHTKDKASILLLLLRSQLYLWGSSFLVTFLRLPQFFFFQSNHRCSHIPSLWMVHAGCVFVDGIHPSRTCQSLLRPCGGMHLRIDQTSVYTLIQFRGNGVRTHVNSKRKIPSEEDRTSTAASRRTTSPTHFKLSYSSP